MNVREQIQGILPGEAPYAVYPNTAGAYIAGHRAALAAALAPALAADSMIDRLATALAFISTADTGGEIFPTGPSDTVYAQDGNTVVDYVGPWYFLRGMGPTFLDAVEDAMRKERQQPPTPHS